MLENREFTKDDILHELLGNCIHRKEEFWCRGIQSSGPMPNIVKEFMAKNFPLHEIHGNDWFRLCPDCGSGGINSACSQTPYYSKKWDAIIPVVQGLDEGDTWKFSVALDTEDFMYIDFLRQEYTAEAHVDALIKMLKEKE